MKKKLCKKIKEIYNFERQIPLHEPIFGKEEKSILNDVIDSGFVSTSGEHIGIFEENIKKYTGASYAISVVNGTSALHLALRVLGVKRDDFVISQPLSFVATANSINYLGAEPIFTDIDPETLSLCPVALENWLEENATLGDSGECVHISSKRRIVGTIIMHTYGNPGYVVEIKKICKKWSLFLLEDAAESLGSFVGTKHSGTIGDIGIFSFNGNKIITCGGGGILVTNSQQLADSARHISTTAKIANSFASDHDAVGYNYRLPNINAALGIAQLNKLSAYLKDKRKIATIYQDFFFNTEFKFFSERKNTKSNYWLNTIICPNKSEMNELSKFLNKNQIYVRPAWKSSNILPMYSDCITDSLENLKRVQYKIINLPSSPRKTAFE